MNAHTTVALVHQPDLADDWLRFGDPAGTRRINPRRSLAYFASDTLFAFVRWRGGEYGTTLWQLRVLRAGQPGEAIETVSGVTPGAVILLAVSGAAKVKRVFALIDAIEANGIDPCEVAVSWWRVAHNRIAANRDVRPYGRDEHRADLMRRRTVS